MNRTKVFLDMDGVLTNFVDACCEAHGKKSPYSDPKSFGIFNMEKLWNITVSEFWAPLDKLGRPFWENMGKMPDADEIVKTLEEEFGRSNICILTSPSYDPGCIPGKREWIKKHYPQFRNQILYGTAKRFLAGDNRVLVDDRDENVNSFVEHGGKAVLIPRLWNCNHALCVLKDAASWTLNSLRYA